MSKKNRKDKKKAKKAMAEMETRDENLTQEEQNIGEEAETKAPDQEELNTEAQEKAEGQSEECAPESEEQTQEGDSAEDSETAKEAQTDGAKPKKERKLKWARSSGAEKKPDPIEEKLNEINDRYARLFAEFDNFRKRSDKEKTQRYDFGVKDTVEKILPVIDNFERGLAAVPEDRAEDSFVTGMQMIYKQLMKTLEDIGVKPIEAVGQEFNPDFHNAVMHVDDPEAGDNIIVEEFQKGYMYKDHVVRYSMVKVAN